MLQRLLALGVVLIVTAFAADAAEQFPLNIVVDGSLPFQYESNPTRVPTNKQPDNAFSPFLKLSVLGDLRPDLSYSFYAAASANQYLQSQDNTGSMAAFGTQVI